MKTFSQNVLAVLASGVAPFAVTLITLPMLISLITLERYGVLAIVWMITGSVGFIQLGMGRAVVQRINAAKRVTAKSASDLRNPIIANALAITAVTSLVAGAVAVLSFKFYFNSFGVAAPELMGEIAGSLPLVGISIVAGFFINLLLGIYQADERFVFYSLLRFFNVVGAQLAPLFTAIIFAPTFDALMMAVAVTRIAVVAALLFGLRDDIRRLYRRHLSRRTSVDLLSFGGWTSVLAILSPLLVILDRFIIGALFGAAVVGTYTVAYNLCSRLFVIPTSISNVILPRLSRLEGTELASASDRGLQVVIMLSTPTLVGFIAFYEVFVSYWMNPEIATDTYRIAAVLAVGVLSASMGQAPYTKLTGEGHVRAIALWHLAQVPFYILALWFALQSFGLLGAAYVWSLRTLVDAVGLFYIGRMSLRRSEVIAFAMVSTAAATQLLLPIPIQRVGGALIVLAMALCVSTFGFVRLGGLLILKNVLPGSLRRNG